MIRDERLRQLWVIADGYSTLWKFARAVEAEATAELRAENERLREALKQFAECDLNDSNCSGLPVAVARIRNIARAALAKEPPC
jgi:hypothetical protein